MVISLSFLPRMRKVSTQTQRKSKHILYSVKFSENRAVNEIMWKSDVEPGRPHITIWRMHFTCWITKATDTHREQLTYCFFKAIMVTRTGLSVMLYVHRLLLTCSRSSHFQTSIHGAKYSLRT